MRWAKAARAGLVGTILALSIAGEGAAAVTVIGTGLASQCSRAAREGEWLARYEELCTQALETETLSPRDYAGTLVNRSVMKIRRAEYDAAVQDLDRALRVKPDLGEAYVNRGAAKIGARRFAEGLADTSRGLALGVEEPEKAYYNRALAHEALQDAKSAYLDYLKAVELNPEWAAPREQLSRFSLVQR